MAEHKPGFSYSFPDLITAFNAKPPGENDGYYFLHNGDEILALCLRHKYNPKPGEVWISTDPVVSGWGKKLAALKDQKTIPVYFSPPSRTMYEYRGYHLITGDTEDAAELAKRKSPVPLSRIVFIKPLQERTPTSR